MAGPRPRHRDGHSPARLSRGAVRGARVGGDRRVDQLGGGRALPLSGPARARRGVSVSAIALDRETVVPARPGRRWRRLLRHRLAVIGLVIMATVGLLAIFADRIAPRSPTSQQILLRLKPPGFVDPRTKATAWLGTDHLGRDILSRII